MDSRRKAGLIKRWALEVGFDRAGVAHLEPSAHRSFFLGWLARSDHADMDYLARRVEIRLDPRRILRGARSVVCVALQYHPLAGERPPPGDLWPGVARYGRGSDYHALMLDRLRSLAKRIQEAFPGTGARPYVDTGPVLERELAARAGLGAIGKNTNLLDPDAGSWSLLGELLLTLDLAPDSPIADLCGSCSRCLEACPTGALPEPYRLDSNRCISYWTIEHRGVVPPMVRAQLGAWVFGCDICQEVCPLNAVPTPGEHPELHLPPERAELDLVGLLMLTRERYAELFRGSPMKRAKLEGLKRNAAVAMGNSRRRRYVPALVTALGEGAPVVRRHAAWALGRIGGERARDALAGRLSEEHDATVRGEIRNALEGSAVERSEQAQRDAGGLGLTLQDREPIL